MPLSQARSKVITDPRKFLHCIYGEAGVGKTDFASQIEGHHFLMAEEGVGGVQVYSDPVPTWSDYINKCIELQQAKTTNFEGIRRVEVVVIDTYDALWTSCAKHVMATETFMDDETRRPTRFDRVDDVGFGKAYKRVNETLMGTITKLRLLGYGVFILAHSKERVVKWNGQKLDGITLALSGSAQDALTNECDAIGYAMVNETISKDDQGNLKSIEHDRWIYWQPTFLRLGKHRLKNFPEKTSMPMGTGWEIYEKTFTECANNLVEK